MPKLKGYTEADLAEVMDHAEWTRDDFRKARPAREVLPQSFFDELEKRRARGPQKAPTKKQLSLRLDQDVVDTFRATGPGWQSRINAALRKAAGLKKAR